jgi:hypothetical protein
MHKFQYKLTILNFLTYATLHEIEKPFYKWYLMHFIKNLGLNIKWNILKAKNGTLFRTQSLVFPLQGKWTALHLRKCRSVSVIRDIIITVGASVDQLVLLEILL